MRPNFDHLYYFNNPHNVLRNMMPSMEKACTLTETSEVNLDHTYFVVGPWKYNEERQAVFNSHYLHVDNGYFFKTKAASMFRLTYRGLQESKIFDCDNKRLDTCNFKIKKWNNNGDYILIVAPDSWPPRYYDGLKTDIEWIINVKHELRKYTDRKIFYRLKESRKDRGDDKLDRYLDNAWAVVTSQSLASIESICSGVPVFNLASSCCDNVALQDLSKIEHPYRPDNRQEWLASLSYGQFSRDEISSGFAREILKDRYL